MNRIDPERARRMAWLALGVYIVGLGIAATLRFQGDFIVYWRAGHRVLHSAAIYPPDDKDRFLYAPIFAIAFAPFALLPRHAAQAAFFVVNAAGLIAFIIGTGAMLFGRAHRLSAALIAVPVILTCRFIGNNIEHGQINLPTLALCVWAIVYARESQSARSGAMLAAAILIKPFAILAALYLLIRGKFGALGWSVVAGIVLLAAPVLVFGPHGLVEQTVAYLSAVSSMTTRYRTMLTNQSAVSAIARIVSRSGGEAAADGPAPFAIGMAIEGAMIAIAMVWAWLSGDSERDGIRADWLALSAIFCIMPGFAPISWKSYFVALIVPHMTLVAALWESRPPSGRGGIAAVALFALSAILNFAPGRYPNRIAMFYSAHLISSILAFAALAALAIEQRRAQGRINDFNSRSPATATSR